MAEEIKPTRKKPDFRRTDWHKKIRFSRKKNLKWRAAKGRHNKIRLSRAGHPGKVKIGWGNKSELKNQVNGMDFERVENLMQIKNTKMKAVIIGRIGKKLREEILKIAKEKGIVILNRYRSKNATK